MSTRNQPKFSSRNYLHAKVYLVKVSCKILITSDTRAEMHLFLIISINLYVRNSIKFNVLASSGVIVLKLIIFMLVKVMGIIRSKFFPRFLAL